MRTRFVLTIFAMLLFLLFAGKLLEGGVFPKVSFEMIFSFNAVDFDGTEFSKLLVWCFIAGFAEKFVPDKLTAMTQKANTPPPPAKPV